MSRAPRFVPSIVVMVASLSSCGPGSGTDSTITVSAAASLTGAFTEIGAAFAEARPDVDVVFNFAGSAELSTQVIEGAPADVLATADSDSMSTVLDDAALGERNLRPRVFARNTMAIAVATGNPAAILGLDDLARKDLVTVMCDVAVPCGRYARMVLDRAGLKVTAKSLESNVKAVVTKVALGEADAGLVYATDVVDAGDDIEGIALRDSDNVEADYPIVALSPSPAALAFVEFVLSAVGQEILVRHGFRSVLP